MTEFVKVDNLKLHYRIGGGVVKAVDGVSFEIERPGQALALIGESGCGKSSVGLALLRLLPSNTAEFSGQVWLGGREIMRLPEADFREQFRWKKIAWVPQNTKGSLDPIHRVRHEFEEVFKTHGIRQPAPEIEKLLSMVGLTPNKADAIPDRLSGGEIQRACIALAIALKPDLVILDEPTSALDASLKGQIISLLSDLKQQFASSYLFITHDINQASSICEYFAVLYAGRIVEKGSRAAVLGSPRHPYTRKLLECIEIDRSKNTPAFIPGEPPDLRALPPGCPFQPRCDVAMPACREIAPALEDKRDGHFAACHVETG